LFITVFTTIVLQLFNTFSRYVHVFFSSIFTMSATNAILKRAHDDAEAEFDDSTAKKAKVDVELPPTHPYAILDHLVKNVLPAKCANRFKVKRMYQQQLDDPEATISECKQYLTDWVMDLWKGGKVFNAQAYVMQYLCTIANSHYTSCLNVNSACVSATNDVHCRLKKHAKKTFPAHGVIYLILLFIDGELWRYAGQTKDGQFRIIKQHQSPSYRKKTTKYLYYLWERASSVHFLLPVAKHSLPEGPKLNILEQWVALIFLGLRHHDLQENLSKEAVLALPKKHMHRGAGVREPLAQGFAVQDYPMSGRSLKFSPEPLARQFWVVKQDQEARALGPRAKDILLKGDLWPFSFPLKSDAEVRVFILKHYFEVLAFVRDMDDIRVRCDLLPPNDEPRWHPNSVVAGMWAPARYNDPARRLGIEITGIINGHPSSWWVTKSGDSDRWVPIVNTIVDVLEARNPAVIRPRRWYADGRDVSTYRFTRHPIDSNAGDEWATPLTFEDFEKSNYVSEVLANREAEESARKKRSTTTTPD
jgi:hypothetical protein